MLNKTKTNELNLEKKVEYLENDYNNLQKENTFILDNNNKIADELSE
jgi:hypothetical protein